MTEGPVASIVVPSYRGAARLPVLFDALRAQRFSGEWEAVIVLDGDVDGSAAVVEAAARDLPLRMVRFDENRGRPAALSAGFSAARGDVLIRCDDDMEPDPSYVAGHVLAHRGPDPVGVVGLARYVLPETPYARLYGRPRDARLRADAYAAPPETRWRYWAGNCSVTAATYAAVGPYDEAFRAYGWEDIDWGRRLTQSGVPIVLDPRVEVVHHADDVSTAARVRRAFLSGRSQVRFEHKHGVIAAGAPGSGLRGRVWSTAVDAMARASSADAVERRGAALDRLLGVLPGAVGARAIALLVEAAAESGHRCGQRTIAP